MSNGLLTQYRRYKFYGNANKLMEYVIDNQENDLDDLKTDLRSAQTRIRELEAKLQTPAPTNQPASNDWITRFKRWRKTKHA